MVDSFGSSKERFEKGNALVGLCISIANLQAELLRLVRDRCTGQHGAGSDRENA